MRTTLTILKYTLAALIVVILGGLSGWYFFLRTQTSSTAAISTARGLGVESPSFAGTTGSTAANAAGKAVEPAASISTGGAAPGRLWEVYRTPVAGAGFAAVGSTFATSTAVYFAERASGYIFAADPSTGNVRRLTNTLMPKTYEAVFVPTKHGVLLRSLDKGGGITTFAGTLSSTTTAAASPAALSGYYLAKNMLSIAVDQKSGALFYLTPAAAGGVVGTTLQWNGSKQKQLFTSALASWRPQWSSGQVVLAQSPADDVPGYAFTLRGAGALAPLLGPVPGLTILPHPSENALLYGASRAGVLALYAQIGKNPAALLPIKTIPEKCVWAPGQSLIVYCAVPSAISSTHFLDDWYQGVAHTADTWWQVGTTDGTAEVLYAPPQALDVQDPAIDPSGNYIAFVNGSDQSLWMLRIAQ